MLEFAERQLLIHKGPLRVFDHQYVTFDANLELLDLGSPAHILCM